MKVSLNTIKQFIDLELPPVDELVERINRQLGGVEDVIDLGAKYRDAVIVRVVECEKHPNADKLNVTKIDDGGVVADVPRDDNGYVQVVCGAPNVHADMFAVWLPPKSTVPATYDDAEPFVLGARELRGVLSQGMMAAADELAIGGDHGGIVEINPSEWRPYDVEIKPGASFAAAYSLDDMIIDIENKMFTHRPDLFGQLGVAREIAGIFGHQFTSPEWYLGTPTFADATSLALETFNDTPDNVPRAMFVAMQNIEIKPSPLWLQCALVAMGSKPINNIVDVTNYVMLLTAQPTHAYDYDKLRGHTIGARMAREGEKVTLLNDKTYELTPDDIVIADADGPVALGGIMGGADSEVDETTKNIVLEVATFDMYAVRKSSMRHGIFTDALTRFNKGQSPLQNDHVMSVLMASVKDVSPAEQASHVFDLKNTGLEVKQHDDRVSLGINKDITDVFSWGAVTGVNVLENSFVNNRLGLDLSPKAICKLLRKVEIKAYEEPEPDTPNQFEVSAPFWRTDLEFDEDIVEEVGRLYGFDKLPRELPRRSIVPAPVTHMVATKHRVREAMLRAGANEVLTYSFVHEKTLRGAGQNPEHAYQISNALSPDLQYYRLSLVPSLLGSIRTNLKAGHDEFVLYELGKAHDKRELDADGLPREFERLGLVVACKNPGDGAAYYWAQQYLRELLDDLHITAPVTLTKYAEYDFGDDTITAESAQPFDPERAAVVTIGGRIAGIFGEFRADVTRAFKLPDYTAGAELSLTALDETAGAQAAYQPLSKYPRITRDVSLDVAAGVAFERVLNAAQVAVATRSDCMITITPVTIYQATPDVSHKTITLRVAMTAHDRTLTEDEATAVIDAIRQQVAADVV